MPVITNTMRQPNELPQMAKTLGVDMSQAVTEHRIMNFQYHDAAHKCHVCAEKHGCNQWLENHTAGATEAPSYCGNKDLLEMLRG